MSSNHSLSPFERDVLENVLFNLPDSRRKIAQLRIERREFDGVVLAVQFQSVASGAAWSMTMDSEIRLSDGVYLEAEVELVDSQPAAVRVGSVNGVPWNGHPEFYVFEEP